MNIEYTRRFLSSLRKKTKKYPKLKQSVAKQLKLFKRDWRHPSLRVHKLKGRHLLEYSIWIENDIRITFVLDGDTAVLVDMYTHDEYQRQKKTL